MFEERVGSLSTRRQYHADDVLALAKRTLADVERATLAKFPDESALQFLSELFLELHEALRDEDPKPERFEATRRLVEMYHEVNEQFRDGASSTARGGVSE